MELLPETAGGRPLPRTLDFAVRGAIVARQPIFPETS
jgi:hypothetical protein